MKIPYNTIIETRELYEEAKKSDKFLVKLSSKLYKMTMYRICKMLDSTLSKTNIIDKRDLVLFGNFLESIGLEKTDKITYTHISDRYILTFNLVGLSITIDTADIEHNKFYIITKTNTTRIPTDSRVEMEFISTSGVYAYGEYIYETIIETIKNYIWGELK